MERVTIPADWAARLASAIAAAVREYLPTHRDIPPVVAFHVGCFPWHGQIELSALTADELAADPALQTPGEVAAWRHYNFTAGLTSWETVAELGRQMSSAYSAADEKDRPATTDAFLHACAVAVGSQEVLAALAVMNRDPRFTISVTHPDSDHEFYPPDASTHA